MKYIISDYNAKFYFPAPCKYCKTTEEIEMSMSKADFDTIKIKCLTCQNSWEY